MVLISPGEFLMGSTEEEQARFLEEARAIGDRWAIKRIPSEGPRHRVRITKPFYLGKHEVTQAQWQSVIGANPSNFNKVSTHPVETIAWEDVQSFIARLNHASAEQATYSLPTEAQWEYACRAGTTTFWYSGDGEDDLRQHGWFKGRSGKMTHPVGMLAPNPFGLHDMHGNVWEWCADWYAEDGYTEASLDDPVGPSEGSIRVGRGGGWDYPAWGCRSAYRITKSQDYRSGLLGFRLAASIDVERPGPELRKAADRAAAEWMLDRGWDFAIDVEGLELRGSSPLPKEEFQVTRDHYWEPADLRR